MCKVVGKWALPGPNKTSLGCAMMQHPSSINCKTKKRKNAAA